MTRSRAHVSRRRTAVKGSTLDVCLTYTHKHATGQGLRLGKAAAYRGDILRCEGRKKDGKQQL